MAPRLCAAYCCARKGCGGYRYVHLALANNEALECAKCGDRFPKRPCMIPEPRRPPRDEARAAGSKGKGKGKGKEGQTQANDKGKGRGGPSVQARARAKAHPKAKAAANPRPWNAAQAAAPSTITIDAKRLHDPTYFPTLQVVVAERLKLPDKVMEAKQSLAAERAKQEAELPPDRRLVALRKRLRIAEASASKHSVRVQDCEQQLVQANTKLHDAKVQLREQQAEVKHIQEAIEATELALPPQGAPLPVGPVARPKPEPQIEDLIEMTFQAVKGKYALGESGLHILETQLRQLESFKDNLDIKKEEDEWRTKQASHKRERPPDDNVMEDDITPVAEDEPKDSTTALREALATADSIAQQARQQEQPPTETRATTDAAPSGPGAPCATAPAADAAPAAHVQPPVAAAAAPPSTSGRGESERSPRREPDSADKHEPGIHEAARGGAEASNQRGGGSHPS